MILMLINCKNLLNIWNLFKHNSEPNSDSLNNKTDNVQYKVCKFMRSFEYHKGWEIKVNEVIEPFEMNGSVYYIGPFNNQPTNYQQDSLSSTDYPVC